LVERARSEAAPQPGQKEAGFRKASVEENK
jgi:hypothetical protein